MRHLVRSRSGQPLIDVPAQPAAVHLYHTLLEPKLLAWIGTSRGYSTAARALVGKSYAPSAPRAGLRTPDAEAAEGLRLAVDVGRGARGQRGPRAISPGSRSPKGSTGLSCLAGQARSSDAVEEVARQCCVLASLALRAGLSRASLSLSFLSLSLSLTLSPCACVHASCERRACARTPTRAPSGMRAGMACDGMTRTQ